MKRRVKRVMPQGPKAKLCFQHQKIRQGLLTQVRIRRGTVLGKPADVFPDFCLCRVLDFHTIIECRSVRSLGTTTVDECPIQIPIDCGEGIRLFGTLGGIQPSKIKLARPAALTARVWSTASVAVLLSPGKFKSDLSSFLTSSVKIHSVSF